MATLHLKPDSLPQTGDSQIVSASSLRLSLSLPPKKFYRHGWQSWSLAAWTDLTPLPIQRPTLLHPMQTDPVYVNETLPNSSWVAAVEFAEDDILLLGALGLEAHVTLRDKELQGQYEAGEGDWLITRGNEATVFARYADELDKRLGKKSDHPAPRVWCSWYSLYTAIDEQTLYSAFDGLKDLPFDVLQVDDGWQLSIGDWEVNKKFPSGMTALADKIKSTRRKAGLWLAPLIAVESSRLFREHPDWFLHDEHGKFVSAGFNWGEQLFTLDTTHPAVLEWLAALMKQVRAWGFDYLKLDFLYGGALPGKRHADMPREAAFRQGLKVMREAMGSDAYFLTCGTPILPSLGLCDAIRVGADVGNWWDSRFYSYLLYNQTTPSVVNGMRTSLNRLWLKPLVYVDPDVAFFAESKSLTDAQKRLFLDLTEVTGFKATSDLPEQWTNAQREDVRQWLESKPRVERTGQYVFTIDGREVDFSPAMPLPPLPNFIDSLAGEIIGFLGNQSWALKIWHWLIRYGSVKKDVEKSVK